MSSEKITEITVIGAGLAGSSFLEALRKVSQSIEVTLIDKNDFYFPKDQLSKDPVDLKKIKKISQWARDAGFNFISARVDKISEKRKKIYLDNSKKVEFKNLVVASGALSKRIDIKGTRKEGFFYLSEINPYDLKTLLKIHNEVTLSAATLEGIKFSLLFKSLKKEVRIVAADLDFLGPDKEKIIDFLKRQNIEIHLGYKLDEVIGERAVKAVKIKKEKNSFKEDESFPVKLFSSQLVFADSGLKPNLGFLDSSGIDLETKCFFSKYGQIYIAGDAANAELEGQKSYRGNKAKVERGSAALANYILGLDLSQFKTGQEENQENRFKEEIIEEIYDKEG
ncbi:MAG: NAD(P)/FAD-dependent oxidoreductase [Candidatus Omnitrophica bacterium]|nr:NAD(P)/FAD-dependent oxidoreductase [Candidatus Omnitrophota bacterium]MCF7877597.1 NAD(P)/FAD-dependent oxidoreductase [Candidatus Omnitrophota bacterium]MCF7877915.1 NAD(P)/FAD-dependent oxidoreductase [Candidatus Omnitrophota bacterium]MCF7893174.1 NAD(P)/FAD-dependent oxidoreductase [Candidatus Omnitrophota bacterium]